MGRRSGGDGQDLRQEERDGELAGEGVGGAVEVDESGAVQEGSEGLVVDGIEVLKGADPAFQLVDVETSEALDLPHDVVDCDGAGHGPLL